MKKIFFIVVIILILLTALILGLRERFAKPTAITQPDTNNSANTVTPARPETFANGMIRVASPSINGLVSSPLTIAGEARGNWYFEASFPVTLKDAYGNVLAQQPVQAQGEWMTENFVPFSTTLNFATPTETTGLLILEKDNPSGLAENADYITIPVRFK